MMQQELDKLVEVLLLICILVQVKSSLACNFEQEQELEQQVGMELEQLVDTLELVLELHKQLQELHMMEQQVDMQEQELELHMLEQLVDRLEQELELHKLVLSKL